MYSTDNFAMACALSFCDGIQLYVFPVINNWLMPNCKILTFLSLAWLAFMKMRPTALEQNHSGNRFGVYARVLIVNDEEKMMYDHSRLT